MQEVGHIAPALALCLKVQSTVLRGQVRQAVSQASERFYSVTLFDFQRMGNE